LYQSKQDYRQAEATYHRCLEACRNVQLWLDYLQMLRSTTLDKLNRQDEKQYNLTRQTFEGALERAITNVGMAPDSYPLWRVYIDFVKEFPELNTADPARRVQSLRKVYQRAICVPSHDLDTLWREYESLERSAGELLAERVLPEFRDRHAHAKAIFKERERLTSMLALDRLALPPRNQSSGSFESQQLDTWNKWIR